MQVPGQGGQCETYGRERQAAGVELLSKASLQRLRLAAFHSETKQDAADGKRGGSYEHKNDALLERKGVANGWWLAKKCEPNSFTVTPGLT